MLDAPGPRLSEVDRAAAIGLLLLGPGTKLLLWLVGRRRWPWLSIGMVVAGIGWLATLVSVVATAVAIEEDIVPPGRMFWAVLVGGVTTAVTVVALALWSGRTRTPEV